MHVGAGKGIPVPCYNHASCPVEHQVHGLVSLKLTSLIGKKDNARIVIKYTQDVVVCFLLR